MSNIFFQKALLCEWVGKDLGLTFAQRNVLTKASAWCPFPLSPYSDFTEA